MDNPDNVIVTPWKIEEVPLDHWFKHRLVDAPRRVTGITASMQGVFLDGDQVSLEMLAISYMHSEIPVGKKANWQRCGHVEPRGVVWVGRGDLYFRRDTAVINGVRYAVDGAEAITVEENTSPSKPCFPFYVSNTNCGRTVKSTGISSTSGEEQPQDVVPAIRMEAK